MTERPCPDGIAWDEALRQRQRAEEAEAEIKRTRAVVDAATEYIDRWNDTHGDGVYDAHLALARAVGDYRAARTGVSDGTP